jgi:hypothetical protein
MSYRLLSNRCCQRRSHAPRLGKSKYMGNVRYILLDQNHWIYLARAYQGTPKEPCHHELAFQLLDLVERGDVRLPISMAHLIELMRAEAPERRLRLAEVFERFGQGWFTAAWSKVLPDEINRGVAIALGKSTIPPPPEVFGPGFMFGTSPGIRNDLELRWSGNDLQSFEQIAALPGAILDLVTFPNEDGRNHQNKTIAELNRRNAASIEKARKEFRQSSRTLHRRAKLARYTYDFQSQLNKALSGSGISLENFLSRGIKFLVDFWALVPSLHVDCELTVYRDRQWSRSVDPNDFADIGHLVLEGV